MQEAKLYVFSPAYWRTARAEFRNVRVLAFAGLVCAMAIVLEGLPIYLLGPSLKIYFSFLVVGLGEEDFASLTPELAQKYEEHFHQPEDFIRLGHRMMVVRVPDEAVCPEESKTTPPKAAGFDR